MSDLDLRQALRPELLEPKTIAELRRRLEAGAPCLVRDVFRPELAERLHRALDALDGWKPRDVFQTFVTYNNGAIDWSEAPDDLREFERIFSSESSRRWMEEITGTPCDEAYDFNAGIFRPGDYGLPHPDYGDDGRSVSFVWHASKGWEPAWGGDFCWCAPPIAVSTTFNQLVLFRVTPRSFHYVSSVSPDARAKRLTLHGWYRSKQVGEIEKPRISRWSLGPVDQIGPGMFAVGPPQPPKDE